MAVRITCINKDGGYHENPYVAISHLGWQSPADGSTGKTTRLEMYRWVTEENGVAYVERNGNKAFLIGAVSPRGTKYVKTEPNDTERDNLLKLPECV